VLRVTDISRALICPGYRPIPREGVMAIHDRTSVELYDRLSEAGFLCVSEAGVYGRLMGYRIGGRVDLLCYREGEIHIFEVKSVDRCYPSHIVQALLYAMILARNGFDTKRVKIHIICQGDHIEIDLSDVPERYITYTLEALERFSSKELNAGPWCRYCGNNGKCPLTGKPDGQIY
jgi:CRISPR/Cas system-associated exonuclease Cas4 (RecB family)